MKALFFLLALATTLGAQVPVTPVPAGRKVIFSASAEGTTPFTYVWYKNGQPIAGETSSSLTIENVSAADSGTYRARISNSVGSADSNEIAIAVPQGPTRATISLSILP